MGRGLYGRNSRVLKIFENLLSFGLEDAMLWSAMLVFGWTLGEAVSLSPSGSETGFSCFSGLGCHLV